MSDPQKAASAKGTYEVTDPSSGRKVQFDWNLDTPPTDADMEEVFKAAGAHAPAAEQPSTLSQVGSYVSDLVHNLPASAGKFAQGVGDLARGLGEGYKAFATGGASVLLDPESVKQNIVDNPAVQSGVALVRGVNDLALSPFYLNDKRLQASAQVPVQAAKQFGHSLTAEGIKEDPIGGTLNAISLVDPLLSVGNGIASTGARLENGGVNLLSHTLGRSVTDKEGLLDASRTMLKNNIERSKAGQESLARAIAPIASEKTTVIAEAPPVRLSEDSFPNLQNLISEARKDTPNSSDPFNAATRQQAKVLSDPNLFDIKTRSLTADEVNQMMRDAAGDPEKTQQVLNQLATDPQITTREPIEVPLSYIERLKQKGQKTIARAKGFTQTERLNAKLQALNAQTQDWHDIVANADPRIEPLNEQLAPLYNAQSQLKVALDNPVAPHYGSWGSVGGAILGGTAGAYLGHPWIGTGLGAKIGASLASNPYQLMGNAAQRMFNVGNRLQQVGGAMDAIRPSNLLRGTFGGPVMGPPSGPSAGPLGGGPSNYGPIGRSSASPVTGTPGPGAAGAAAQIPAVQGPIDVPFYEVPQAALSSGSALAPTPRVPVVQGTVVEPEQLFAGPQASALLGRSPLALSGPPAQAALPPSDVALAFWRFLLGRGPQEP